MSAEIDREIAEPEAESDESVPGGVTGPEEPDLTTGRTPAQERADDETRAPEQDGGDKPQP
ncbi:MAG: hypothetical protein H7Z41_20200 [Cytophagales bacterium]|nr:hypothetical protein [Armatimonadota bacterium]